MTAGYVREIGVAVLVHQAEAFQCVDICPYFRAAN